MEVAAAARALPVDGGMRPAILVMCGVGISVGASYGGVVVWCLLRCGNQKSFLEKKFASE